MDSDKFVTPITNFNQSPLDDTKDFQLNHQSKKFLINFNQFSNPTKKLNLI